jgi:hypothetical protein
VALYTTSALTLGMAYLAFPLGAVTMIVGVLRSFTMLWNVRKYEEEAEAAALVAEI